LGRLKVPCPREACWGLPLRLSQINSGYPNETSVLTGQEEGKGEQAMTIQDAMHKAVEGGEGVSELLIYSPIRKVGTTLILGIYGYE
jgi:hypothetical protein